MDGVRDGLGEGVVEAEADESALPPNEGDHHHAISDAISMQSATSWHSHLGSHQLRAVGWRPSHPNMEAEHAISMQSTSTGGRATREPRG